MSSTDQILFDIADGVATITLNRPEKLNAYTVEMGDEVVAAFRNARENTDVRVIVLTGAGRAFCAGVDLDALKAQQKQGGDQQSRLGREEFLTSLPLEMRECPKPVIAAINGHAIGVGMTMALPCDVRIAADRAKLGLTFAKLGILPGLGSTHLLPKLVGMARAQELVLTAEPIRGEEAAAIGLVNKAVPSEEVLPAARAMAAAMCAIEPAVLEAAKRILHTGADLSMADAMANERSTSSELRKTREAARS